MKLESACLRSPDTSIVRRRFGRRTAATFGAIALALTACGGDDDAASTTTAPPVEVLPATSTTVAATATATTTTVPTTTTLPPLVLVTEGATVVVANASGVDGAAGRMTAALAAVGFSMGDAGNSTEGQLATTKVYYDVADPEALAVAESVREALGGGDIELVELTVPAPLQDPEIGDATIVLAMGNDTADKSLDELQGRTTPETTEASSDSTVETTEASSDSGG